MAAALAKGKTKLVNVAKEPEVVQLCEVLAKAGLDIKGIGTDELGMAQIKNFWILKNLV